MNEEGFFSEFYAHFYHNFIAEDRYMYLVNGLYTTVTITFFAVILGIFIGIIVATIRSSSDILKTSEVNNSSFGMFVLGILDKICKVYLSLIRGTPIVVQLFITYFIIFQAVRIDKTLVAILAFGVNSGAYVAEIFRSGIMSIDKGQFEAGRSLGFNYIQTMLFVVMPQALKNILPALANEFIVLLKETSVVGYLGAEDLTRGGDIIRSQTYNPEFPLFGVALIYWIMISVMTYCVSKFERRLRANDK